MSTFLSLIMMFGVNIAFGMNEEVSIPTAVEGAATRDGVTTERVLSLSSAEEWYEKGIDLRMQRRFKEAFEITKKAADAGWPMAQYAVGGMYLGGIGADINVELAFDYYEKCCSEVAEAWNQMGAIRAGIYRQAGDDYQDEKEALKCYEEAAKMGLPAGKDNLKRLRLTLEMS